MGLSANELNVKNVKTLIKNVKLKKVSKVEAAKELNRRFNRMKVDDIPWYEDLYPKYVQAMKE